jgi:hypothetical protein
MTTVAELKQNAEQCFCMAERTRDRDIKASWSRLAETWLSLADQESKRGALTMRGSLAPTRRRRTRSPSRAA